MDAQPVHQVQTVWATAIGISITMAKNASGVPYGVMMAARATANAK